MCYGKGCKGGCKLQKIALKVMPALYETFLQLYSTPHSLKRFFWSQVTCSSWLLQCWPFSKRQSKYHDNPFLHPLKNGAGCLFIARHKKHMFVRSWVILAGSGSWSWVALGHSGVSSCQSYSLHTLHVTQLFIQEFKNNAHFHRQM